MCMILSFCGTLERLVYPQQTRFYKRSSCCMISVVNLISHGLCPHLRRQALDAYAAQDAAMQRAMQAADERLKAAWSLT